MFTPLPRVGSKKRRGLTSLTGSRSHLPLLFIGMEQMMLSHLIHADEALSGAHAMCDVDPLLVNERGVFKFYNLK